MVHAPAITDVQTDVHIVPVDCDSWLSIQTVIERQRVSQTEVVGSHRSGLWQDRQAKLLRIDHLHPQTVPVSLQPVGQGSSRSGSF